MDSTHEARAARMQALLEELRRLCEEHGTDIYVVAKEDADRLNDASDAVLAERERCATVAATDGCNPALAALLRNPDVPR